VRVVILGLWTSFLTLTLILLYLYDFIIPKLHLVEKSDFNLRGVDHIFSKWEKRFP
jgi:hypothetical protein